MNADSPDPKQLTLSASASPEVAHPPTSPSASPATSNSDRAPPATPAPKEPDLPSDASRDVQLSTPRQAETPQPVFVESDRRLREFNAISPIAITLLNGIGWVLAYFLILSPQAKQNESQAKLLDEQVVRLQSAQQKLLDQLEVSEKDGRVRLDDSNRRLADVQIARLEAAAIRLEDQIANLRARSQTATDLNAVRQSLRPNVTFGKFEFTFPRTNTVELEHDIRNIGTNTVIVSQPVIKLALQPMSNTSSDQQLLAQGRHYNMRTYQIGLVQPGETRRVGYTIDLLNGNLRGTTLYYVVQWTTSVDKAAISTAQQLLGKQASAEDLTARATQAPFLVGSIVFSR